MYYIVKVVEVGTWIQKRLGTGDDRNRSLFLARHLLESRPHRLSPILGMEIGGLKTFKWALKESVNTVLYF